MYEVAIIGGGLSGMASAVHLARQGVQVVLFEQHDYPRNKVCGEYISNEVLPYLASMGLDPAPLKPKAITRFSLSAPSGKTVHARLPLGGFSVRRFSLDKYWYDQALKAGVTIHVNTAVTEARFTGEAFEIQTKQGAFFHSRLLIGSYGKRSLLDRKLARTFFQERSAFIGVKSYFAYDMPDDLVALHNFPGGYCGLSQVENGHVNVAYLTTKQQLTRYGSIEELEAQAVCVNPHLREVFQGGTRISPKPWVISNISFRPKSLVEDHILMSGDAAGMIPPLAGNGMAMAITAGKIAAELCLDFLAGTYSHTEIETIYRKQWNNLFRRRLFWGRRIQRIMGQPFAAEIALGALRLVPGILPQIIKQTHGAPGL